MPARARTIILSFLLIVFIISCRRNENERIQPTSTFAVTPVSTSPPVSIQLFAEDLASDVNYLTECRLINSTRTTEQIAYKNVLPGKTTETELRLLFGTPDKTSVMKGVTDWVYGNIGLTSENGVITYILVPFEGSPDLTLKWFVLTYGCPDFIFAVNTSSIPGNFDDTLFVYHHAGFEIQFGSYPAAISDVPVNISYFQPAGIQEYIDENGWAVLGLGFGKPVVWTDAVK